MRSITTHHINGCNRQIEILATDGPGPGGASHHYLVRVHRATGYTPEYPIVFQNGAIREVGVNGLTHEALLAIIIDRLEAFQRGPYACPENLVVLNHLNAAVAQLHSRTKRRDEQGTEGTMATDPAATIMPHHDRQPIKSPGQVAYEAYSDATHKAFPKALRGDQSNLLYPVFFAWVALDETIQNGWEAAAKAVMEASK